jgi:peptidase M28-like protein
VEAYPRDRRGWLRVGLLLAAFGVPLAVLGALMIRMPGRSFSGTLPPSSADERQLARRLEAHVRALADEIGERSMTRPGSLEAAARYLERQLRELGYEVEAQEVQGPAARNLAAEIPGGAKAGEIVVVGAHYDSVFGSPGANDNASGSAAVLELARLFRGRSFGRTLRFVLFVNEEPPYFLGEAMGSRSYAARSKARGENVTAMLSLETIGYYSDAEGSQKYPAPFSLFYPSRGDFIGFVGNLRSASLVRRCVGAFRKTTSFPSEGLAAPEFIPGIAWSDHSSFWEQGYPALMVTDTAPFRYPDYHTATDAPDKLRYDRTARVVRGLASVIEDLCL